MCAYALIASINFAYMLFKVVAICSKSSLQQWKWSINKCLINLSRHMPFVTFLKYFELAV